jgi:hypothetical protein
MILSMFGEFDEEVAVVAYYTWIVSDGEGGGDGALIASSRYNHG